MAEERSEYILRVKGVTSEQRRLVEEILLRTAKTFKRSTLSRVDREEHGTHALHIRRKTIHRGA